MTTGHCKNNKGRNSVLYSNLKAMHNKGKCTICNVLIQQKYQMIESHYDSSTRLELKKSISKQLDLYSSYETIRILWQVLKIQCKWEKSDPCPRSVIQSAFNQRLVLKVLM